MVDFVVSSSSALVTWLLNLSSIEKWNVKVKLHTEAGRTLSFTFAVVVYLQILKTTKS